MKRNCTKLSMIGAGLLLSLPLAAQTTETAPRTEDTKPTWTTAPMKTETRRTILVDTTDGDQRVRIEKTVVNGKVQHTVEVNDMKSLRGSMTSDTVIGGDGSKKVQKRIMIRSIAVPDGAEKQETRLRFETDDVDDPGMLKVEIDGSTMNLEGIEETQTFDLINMVEIDGSTMNLEGIEETQTFDLMNMEPAEAEDVEAEDVEETDDVMMPMEQPIEFSIVAPSEPADDVLMNLNDQGPHNDVRIRLNHSAPQAATFQFRIDGAEELTPEQEALHAQMEAAALRLAEKEKELNDLMGSDAFTPEQRKRIATARGAIDSARYILREAEKGVREQHRVFLRRRFGANAVVEPSESRTTTRTRTICIPKVPSVSELSRLPIPRIPSVPAVPELPMDVDNDGNIVFIGRPETIFLSADSVSVVNSRKGECEIRVYNLGNGSRNLVINEIDEDGKPSHITLYSGAMTIMNGGGKKTKIFDVAGDSLVADIDRKVVVISPGKGITAEKQQDEMEAFPDIDKEETAAVSTASDNTGCTLADAVPNPTEGTVSFSFTVPKSQRAAITIHDQHGKLMATVRDENFDAGRHTVMFNAGDLPNGTYFYRLTSGSFVASKALHVVK